MSANESRAINDAYFTSFEEALALFSVVKQVWGEFPGGRFLEPSAGSGMFCRSSRYAGLNVEWTSNELFPETNNYPATYNEDFLQLTPERIGSFDCVVGNPPFGDGLAQKFVNHALNFSDRVAMVLPPESLRPVRLSTLDKDVFVVAHTKPEAAQYTLGGAGVEYGRGTERQVKTVIVLYERRHGQTNNYDLLAGQIPGIEFLESSEAHRATHFIQNWGGCNTRAADRSWGREIPYASEFPLRVTSLDAEALLASRFMDEAVQRWSTGSPGVGRDELTHWLLSATE